MSKSKESIKKMLCFAGFMTILALSFVMLSFAFAGHGQSSEQGMEKRISYAYRGEDEDSVDVVFFGNSDMYRGFSPMDMYKDTGITSVVVGNPGVGLDKMYESMVDMFGYQTPKVVVLETDCFFSTGNYKAKKIASKLASKDSNRTNVNPVVKKYTQVEQFFKNGDDAILTGLNYLFPLVKYHDNWKHMTFEKLFNGHKRYYSFLGKGMVYSSKSKPLPDSQMDYMTSNRSKVALTNTNAEIFEDIYNLCNENGAELVLLTVPSANTWSNNKSDLVSNMAEKYGLHYYDFNEKYPDAFNWKAHTKDAGNHLNYNGALVVTKEFGSILVNDLSIKPSTLTEEQQRRWANDYNKLKKRIQSETA